MSQRDLFTGRSGQLALMAEFLVRELNVAIPEVDIGDDIVVVRNDDDNITRVQVKTANAQSTKQDGGFSAQFNLPLEQLENGPEHLVNAFVVRHRDRWEEFVLVRRSVLEELRTKHDIGSLDGKGGLVLRLVFRTDSITNKGLNLEAFRSRFVPWPPRHEIPEGVVSP